MFDEKLSVILQEESQTIGLLSIQIEKYKITIKVFSGAKGQVC